jgi:hypothetical protein
MSFRSIPDEVDCRAVQIIQMWQRHSFEIRRFNFSAKEHVQHSEKSSPKQ